MDTFLITMFILVWSFSLETIFKGIFPFLAAIIIAVGILLAFPQIATFLPSIARY